MGLRHYHGPDQLSNATQRPSRADHSADAAAHRLGVVVGDFVSMEDRAGAGATRDGPMSNFVAVYRSELWWWEGIVLLRRLLLVLVITLVPYYSEVTDSSPPPPRTTQLSYFLFCVALVVAAGDSDRFALDNLSFLLFPHIHH
jgi:hypothetical protein